MDENLSSRSDNRKYYESTKFILRFLFILSDEVTCILVMVQKSFAF